MMNGFWGFREIRPALLAVVFVLVYQHLSFCWSLSDKGLVLSRSKETVVHDSLEGLEDGNGGKNLCRSYVECSRGNAVALSMEKPRNVAHHRKLMDVAPFNPFGPFFPPFWVSPGPGQSPPPPSPSPSVESFSPSPAPSPSTVPRLAPPPAVSITPSSVPAPAEGPSVSSDHFSRKHHRVLIVSVAIGGSVLVVALFIVIVFSQKNKMAVVRPWATGLSGQLQRAFVAGVPKLRRQELETACEDFSNVIGSSSVCTLYKGTLSSGVEIAVMSLTTFASAKDWSRDHEAQFRKKIDSLSKVNHKNFVNLIGYCEEKEPFTRMMVFEYAPNGTLFEHLHIKEAEHLDWGARMRVIMGTAYCLGHMHQMAPPVSHKNLKSSAIHLSEDSAAKISDFAVWNESADDETDPTPESNVYSFGVILLEAVTGRLPYSPNGTALEDFASDYLRGRQSLREMADPTLTSFHEHQLDGIGEVIKSCLRLSPRLRPTMREVADRLREITGIGPDGAIPKLSPLWWAELEIQSADISN